MADRFVDPFFPNRPVDDPQRFSGRKDQVEAIIDAIYQIKNNNPIHTIITGDRGIGKSSLLLQTKLVAEGDNVLPEKFGIDIGVPRYDFLVGWHDVDAGQGPAHISTGLMHNFQSLFGRLLKNVKLEISLGTFIKIAKKESVEQTVSELVTIFCEDAAKLSRVAYDNKKDGVLFFIDELDRADAESGIATFFKLVAERLPRMKVNNVAFICAGITGAIQKLEVEHASIARTFKDVPIPRLTEGETEEIIKDGFDKVGRTYNNRIPVLTYRLSSGFPEPVHLLGSEMLKVDTDGYVDETDFTEAKERIVTIVRRNKLSMLLKQSGSGKYQHIVLAMAEYDGTNVPLSFISSQIGQTQNQYSTNMSALVERGIIFRLDIGIYAFVDPLLKEYIQKFGIISAKSEED